MKNCWSEMSQSESDVPVEIQKLTKRPIFLMIFGAENCFLKKSLLGKGRFFSESMMHFSHCPKNVPKTILKKRF
jgi:hypothetical protein